MIGTRLRKEFSLCSLHVPQNRHEAVTRVSRAPTLAPAPLVARGRRIVGTIPGVKKSVGRGENARVPDVGRARAGARGVGQLPQRCLSEPCPGHADLSGSSQEREVRRCMSATGGSAKFAASPIKINNGIELPHRGAHSECDNGHLRRRHGAQLGDVLTRLRRRPILHDIRHSEYCRRRTGIRPAVLCVRISVASSPRHSSEAGPGGQNRTLE